MKQGQGLTIAIAVIGLLTLVNSYKLFFGGEDNRTIEPATGTVINNNGATNPSTLPAQQAGNPVQAAVQDNTPKTSIKFEQNGHDFGSIMQNTKNEYSFTFRNTGVEPLIISNARGSCGCTVPNYPKDPIAPGATGTIDVVYSPGMQQGNQTKTVTITANTEPAQTILNITANVKVDPNAPAQPEQQNMPINIQPAGN